MNKKVINIIVGVFIVCLAGGGAYYFYKKSVSAKSLTNNRYYAVAAKKSNIDVTVSGTGTVGAAQTKDVVANNTGTIENLNVNVGDTVTSGQTIAYVGSDTINQQVNKENLAVQQDQLAVNSAKVDADKQKAELTLESDQSALQSAQDQQNAMTLTAPIGGLVVAKNNNNGDTAQQGKALITIADTSSLKVNLSVDELDISKVQVGQKADIKFDAISGKTYSGTVQTISQLGTTTNNVTTYSVVVNVDNADSAIKLGMNANVNIKVTSKQNALVIPVEALVERNGNKYVRVQSSNGSKADSQESYNKSSSRSENSGSRTNMAGNLVQVQTGLENENYVEITSGINEGQKVMIQLPQTTSTNSQNSRGGFGSMGGFGGMSGGRQSQGGNKSSNK
ncbi:MULTISPECIES: efflux RND transporter periplasmic adaptor subunit [Clostridium]|uniref:efflux RND transporter periplasmic adaptor subunit n=1 Tax=Clostridium TaxID=1485 RepID=UPI000826CA96|nr:MULTISPECIES: efflux RND transporter periplasmic adaptor subunit [Clostridium]PJI08037.1 efflux RND transporter periplasmic adaptor subunit [Clostridium sp. CT7]